MYRVAVLTVSDKGSRGEREDLSGKTIKEMVEAQGWQVVENRVVPDDLEEIKQALIELSSSADLILTTGGTGFSPRDNTPEATLAVIEKEVPGLAEGMRLLTALKTPRSLLSRGRAGIRGQTLIINLPGSPKGVRECLGVILPVLGHGLDILTGRTEECGER
ncbi:molybdenum cofactor synthesis domain protein [Ammonifex degensii KC4]|uniref:Molybdenum cofactor synthesis domain protein n=1 Tax=Ammonifex degensii (strain DSM 10501 / KC4) TaxID=429009 RepID=C9RCT1_AMMDK|nr:MogA/MoaB family molybdenum cofactor biosynthesis protein [Ammonifex degensii]ACX52058.1 molybdenum cofactor synthesis domain protein [Ammonifex degensii KC4]